jgi:hypothetical protein
MAGFNTSDSLPQEAPRWNSAGDKSRSDQTW